jgi:hypothetical protein
MVIELNDNTKMIGLVPWWFTNSYHQGTKPVQLTTRNTTNRNPITRNLPARNSWLTALYVLRNADRIAKTVLKQAAAK